MAKNRYDKILAERNQDILCYLPYNPVLFYETANEIRRLSNPETRILEIGCGEGDSTLSILERTAVKLDLLDVSQEMVNVCEEKLQKYTERTHYICADALEYLKTASTYDLIYSAWTIHNFNREDTRKVLEVIYTNLADGGSLVMSDKVYPDDKVEELLKIQTDRYERYLDTEVAEAIIAHEKEDASDEFRLDESSFITLLKNIGFSEVEIVDRVERDVVLIATK